MAHSSFLWAFLLVATCYSAAVLGGQCLQDKCPICIEDGCTDSNGDCDAKGCNLCLEECGEICVGRCVLGLVSKGVDLNDQEVVEQELIACLVPCMGLDESIFESSEEEEQKQLYRRTKFNIRKLSKFSKFL